MLCIRLQRTGNRNNPSFRLVATDKRNSAKKNPLEILGHYLPTRDPAVFEFNQERIEHFVKNGAVPSDTVARLLSKAGVKGLEKFTERYSKKKKKNAPDEPEAPPPPPPAAEAPAEPATEEAAPAAEEAPAEEAKEEAPAEEANEEASTEEEKPAEEAAPEEGDDKKDA